MIESGSRGRLFDHGGKCGPVVFGDEHRNARQFVVQSVDECAGVIPSVIRNLGEVLYTNSNEFVYVHRDYVGKDNNRGANAGNLVRLGAKLLRGRDGEVHDNQGVKVCLEGIRNVEASAPLQ